MKRHILCIFAAVLPAVAARAADEPAAAPATAPATGPAKVVQRTVTEGDVTVAGLDNGLTVIVKPMRLAPVVCVRAYVRAGGMYEREFLGCGISHLCEHLVAKGAVSEPYAPHGGAMGSTRSIVSDIGGQSNASTSLAWTQYYISAGAGKAMDCIDLVAGWMAKAEITEQDFQREHGVVQRELELGKDEPRRQMWYAHAKDVFATHPASVPVIGYAAPLSKLTVEDVRTYHRRMYVPNNMVFVIVGDVNVEKALDRTCQAFAGFPAGRRPILTLPEAPELPGIVRTVRPHRGIEEVLAEISFPSIPLLHEDLYALDVLSTILGTGEASRLVSDVRREKRLVTSISTSSWTPAWGRGIFNVSYRAEPEKADAAEAAVLDGLRAVAADGVTADELARAKRQMVARFVYSQQSVESVASMLGTDMLTTGDVGFSRNYTERVQAVTTEQVHAVAEKYLTFDRYAVTRLVPAESHRAAGAAETETKQASGRMITLDNGLRVVLHATDAVELVSMAFVAEGGVLVETPETNGLGSLMTALATKGTPEMSAEQIAAFFAAAGGSLTGSAGNNSLYWQASVLDDRFDKALGILADVIQRPTFPEKELEILRPSQLAAIDRVDENWQGELNKAFRERFFKDAPYAMLPVGRREVVADATAEQLAAFHKRALRAGDCVLAIYGHFDADATAERVRKLFGDLPAGKIELPEPAAREVPADGERHVVETEKKVAGVIVAAPGMKASNIEDRFAITVLDTIISGYRLPAGWLHTELRGKRLVYVVHAYNWWGLAPGAFMVYAAGQPAEADRIVGIIHKNLRKAAGYTPTQAEVDRAVNTILTAELLGNQSMSSLAMSAALDELYGFGWDFRSELEARYGAVTPADVARVGKKYLSGGYVTVIATPEPKAAENP